MATCRRYIAGAVYLVAGLGMTALTFGDGHMVVVPIRDLQHPPQLMSYLAERNIAVFSSDMDSRDFKLHKPVIKSVMGQLEKHGKGIILMHDFHRHTLKHCRN
jgi:hypothetical protein